MYAYEIGRQTAADGGGGVYFRLQLQANPDSDGEPHSQIGKRSLSKSRQRPLCIISNGMDTSRKTVWESAFICRMSSEAKAVGECGKALLHATSVRARASMSSKPEQHSGLS